MFGDGPLTFQEFAMREPLPLATIHDAVLEFLSGREDCVLFGAQAVNAYVEESRMTQDVDIMSTRGKEFAEDLRKFLNEKFHVAVRLRDIRDGLGYRIYQVSKPSNRHFVDVRPVKEFPPFQVVRNVQVVTIPELIAGKLSALVRRQGTPKSGSDWRDLAILLLTYPDLKTEIGPVADRLKAAGADEKITSAWKELAVQTIKREKDEDEFNY